MAEIEHADGLTERPDLAGNAEQGLGHPERLDRRVHHGELIDAEHLCRYHWIAAAAHGKRVLDAGCGTAYGTAILADTGAAAVTGVDRAGDVISAVRPEMPGNVELVAADLLELPFEDGSFDLIVCFEVIEHLEQREEALDELKRVLASDGVIAVSSPNRDAFPPGNPHHIHEYRPEELRDTLARRFGAVRLRRQHAWFTSAVLDDDELASTDGAPLPGAAVRKAASIEPGEETFDIVLACEHESGLPTLPAVVTLGAPLDQAAMASHAEEAKESAAEVAWLREEREVLRSRLTDVEQELAELPALREASAELARITESTGWKLWVPMRRAADGARESLWPGLRRAVKSVLSRLISR